MSQNHKITSEATDYSQPTFDSDTFYIKHTMTIKIDVIADSQHDGHPWSALDVALVERELHQDIMDEIGNIVWKHIEASKPFSIHRFGNTERISNETNPDN